MFRSSKTKVEALLFVLSHLISFSAVGTDARLLSALNENSKFCTSSHFGNLPLTRLPNGRAYFFSTARVTVPWLQADQYCRTNNMYLASINNAAEYEVIVSELVALAMNIPTGTYLGLSDRLVDGIWRWSDGSFPTIEYWAANEPAFLPPARACAFTIPPLTTTQFSWGTIDCAAPLPFVCEVPDSCSYKVAANGPVGAIGK